MAPFTRRQSRSPSHPRARAQRLEVLIGILSFFVLMATIQAVVLEVRGEPALFAAGLLLVLALSLWWAIRARRRTGV